MQYINKLRVYMHYKNHLKLIKAMGSAAAEKVHNSAKQWGNVLKFTIPVFCGECKSFQDI